MVVETRTSSTSAITREQRNPETKEYIKHLIEKIGDCELDYHFYKTFSKEAKKVIYRVLHKSRAESLEVTYREDDATLSKPGSNQVVKIRMLSHCKVYLNAKEEFPYNPKNFQCDYIARDD